MFKKLGKEIKGNKYTMAVFCLFLGIFIIGWLVYGVVMPSAGKPVYGNRLEGIEEVEITENKKEKIIKSLEEKSFVTHANVKLNGKIINVIVKVKDGTKPATARALNTTVTKNLNEKELSFYDIQLFLTNENENAKNYPIIGYKSAVDAKFTF